MIKAGKGGLAIFKWLFGKIMAKGYEEERNE